MKKLFLKLIRLYQNSGWIRTPLLKTLFMTDAVCRFSPTCSQYSYEAIQKYGVMKGTFIAFKRIIRCHPWSKGGSDPVK